MGLQIDHFMEIMVRADMNEAWKEQGVYKSLQSPPVSFVVVRGESWLENSAGLQDTVMDAKKRRLGIPLRRTLPGGRGLQNSCLNFSWDVWIYSLTALSSLKKIDLRMQSGLMLGLRALKLPWIGGL